MKLTPALIENEILEEHYWSVPGTPATVCVLKLRGNVYVQGMSVPVDDNEYDLEKGRAAARGHAVNQVWEKYGFCVRREINLNAHTNHNNDGDENGKTT